MPLAGLWVGVISNEVIRLNALLYEFMLAYQSCFALINSFYKDMSISSYIK
jgi:hypothetical protein